MKFYLLIFPLIDLFPLIIYPQETSSRYLFYRLTHYPSKYGFLEAKSTWSIYILVKSVDSLFGGIYEPRILINQRIQTILGWSIQDQQGHLLLAPERSHQPQSWPLLFKKAQDISLGLSFQTIWGALKVMDDTTILAGKSGSNQIHIQMYQMKNLRS